MQQGAANNTTLKTALVPLGKRLSYLSSLCWAPCLLVFVVVAEAEHSIAADQRSAWQQHLPWQLMAGVGVVSY